jgi:hypothetical protein
VTDRELLELAAKAAGVEGGGGYYWTPTGEAWHPLTDDGDALRLAVKLQMNVHLDSNMVDVDPDGVHWFSEAYGTDPLAATRRAITRAAAEIGQAMP